MPIDVAVEEPWARVVRVESERHIVACLSNVDDITPDWVGVVVSRAACDTDDVKGVTMEMEWMLGGVFIISFRQKSGRICSSR